MENKAKVMDELRYLGDSSFSQCLGKDNLLKNQFVAVSTHTMNLERKPIPP
jgi:hypothetical protein